MWSCENECGGEAGRCRRRAEDMQRRVGNRGEGEQRKRRNRDKRSKKGANRSKSKGKMQRSGRVATRQEVRATSLVTRGMA